MGKWTLLFLLALMQAAHACTGIQMKADDGSYVNGRTVEFGVNLDLMPILIPRNYAFKGTTNSGPGMSYKARYAALGMNAFGQEAILDGINEKGLCVGVFYFPGYAGYQKISEANRSKALAPTEFSNWILTQFATLEEVKRALRRVVIVSTIEKQWGNIAPPFHFVVYDKSGTALIIEPIDGKLITYENQMGTITNSPTYDWHMSNLRNYINLRADNVSPLTVDGMTLAPFGQGSGMVGLPGDFTPPSRFVQAAIFSYTAIPSKTAEEAIFQTFHILNQFDIPIGVARAEENGVIHTDYTMLTSAKNPNSLQYYFRTYSDQTIRMIDMKKLKLDGDKIQQGTSKGVQAVVDISSAFR